MVTVGKICLDVCGLGFGLSGLGVASAPLDAGAQAPDEQAVLALQQAVYLQLVGKPMTRSPDATVASQLVVLQGISRAHAPKGGVRGLRCGSGIAYGRLRAGPGHVRSVSPN